VDDAASASSKHAIAEREGLSNDHNAFHDFSHTASLVHDAGALRSVGVTMSDTPIEAVLESSLSNLELARVDVEEAEKQLEAVLANLRVMPRAEKTAVSTAIEQALQRLRDARARVTTAEATIASKTGHGG